MPVFFEIVKSMYIYRVGLDRSKNLNLPLKNVPRAHFDNGDSEMKKKKKNRQDTCFVDIQAVLKPYE